MVGALTAQGLNPIEQINRYCFRSVYFRAPGGVLFEIATDDTGFTRRRAERGPGQRDQAAASVQSRRAKIVAAVAPLR